MILSSLNFEQHISISVERRCKSQDVAANLRIVKKQTQNTEVLLKLNYTQDTR